ncbi:SigE family RNA polymerase sigma factor [Promicromonospora panici]|uniref:SigE family RNA polymerase sigma factor n=1 Tax=Promicromonospora panici TaxID=2219658 RepID=UPI001F5D6219|nr:SigE family RNA polymerase sigma factor [Promicromonospora panici]
MSHESEPSNLRAGSPVVGGMNAETAEQPVVDPARARVEVAQDKDAEFVAFVVSAGPYLFRTAHLLSGDAHQAEELVQATFERTYRAWSKARAGEPRAYARRILMNLRIDGWRKERRTAVTDDGIVPLSPAPDHAHSVAVRDELGRALRTLPARQRRVVVLRHLLDLSEGQVADELGISVGTVKSTNARGLVRLRTLLSESVIEAVPEFRLDGQQVLRQAQVAARRRSVVRRAVVVTGVVAVVLGLMLAGPVRVPGFGPVVLPGSDWLRTVLGLDGRGLADLSSDHADTTTCTGSDDDAPTIPVDSTAAALGGFTVTGVIDVADAHAVQPCVDLAVDHEISTGVRIPVEAGTIGAGESVLGWSDTGSALDGDQFTRPSTLHALVPDGDRLASMTVARNERVDGRWPYGIELARQGDRAAWFETPNTQIAGTLPWTLRLLDRDGSVVTVSDSTVLQVAEARAVALSDEMVGWTTASSPSSTGCDKTLHTSTLGAEASTTAAVRERVCAVASSPDGLVVAYQEGSGGPGIGAGDGGSTVIELISAPDETATTTLLSVRNGELEFDPVSAVGYDEGRLAFAVGNLLYVVDTRTLTGIRLRGGSPAVAVDVSDEVTAWSTEDGGAYALVSRGGLPSVLELSRAQASVGVHGDRIVWTQLDDDGASLTFGRVRW